MTFVKLYQKQQKKLYWWFLSNLVIEDHSDFLFLPIYILFPVDGIDAPPPTWEQLENGLVAVRTVVHGLVDYIQNHSKKGTDQQQVKAKLYKKSLLTNFMWLILIADVC